MYLILMVTGIAVIYLTIRWCKNKKARGQPGAHKNMQDGSEQEIGCGEPAFLVWGNKIQSPLAERRDSTGFVQLPVAETGFGLPSELVQ